MSSEIDTRFDPRTQVSFLESELAKLRKYDLSLPEDPATGEERLALAFRAARLGVWDWNLETGAVFYSPLWKQMLGYGETDIEPHISAWQRLVHPDDHEKVISRLKAIFRGEREFDLEFRLRHKQGHYVHILSRGFPVERDSSGRITRIVGTHLDISKRKRAEKALSESEDRFRLLSGVAGRLLATKNPQALVEELCHDVMAHLDCQAFFNFIVDKGSGRLHLNACAGIPDDKKREIEWLDLGVAICGCVAQQGARIVAEDIQHTSDPRANMVRGFGIQAYACHPLLAGERVIGTLSFGTTKRSAFSPEEITLMKTVADQVAVAMTRIESEEALQDEKEILQAVMNGAKNSCLAYLDRDFNFVRVNEAYAASCGYAPEEMIGKNHFTLYPDEENEKIFTRVRDTGVTMEFGDKAFDYPDQPARGTTYWDWVLTPAKDEAGAVKGLVLSLFETTARKRAEEKLREAIAETEEARGRLEQKVQERTADLARRARQLRALAGELTLAEQRERRRMAKVLHDHLQQLLVAAKFRVSILTHMREAVVRKAAAEVEELLGESIETSRSLTAELSPPILHEGGLAAGLEWLARFMGAKHGLRVDVSVGEEMPRLVEDVNVLLFESTRELLLNTVKHARVHSANVNARTIEEESIMITVSDEGRGFEPSLQVAPDDERGGYGLFSIRERLELIGGAMEIDSAPGKGSRIALIAPLSAVTAERTEAPRHEPLAAAENAGAPLAEGKIRVLLADDHVVMREGLARLLAEEPDMEVVGEATDGHEAVREAGRLVPDVILMDLSMPKMNGVEATRLVSHSYPDIRIIGLSMFEEVERAQAMRDAGAVQYLTKSGPASELLSAIRSSMKARPAHP